ncbi:MAG: preprotein translocase subunit SecG [bacterium]|nr:preprotein translocase subunit SecG [bacterium]
MLYGFFVTLYVIVCILLVFFILIQKGKGGAGLGAIGGGSQMLFGGSGGQDIFQKITWILGAIFIVGSLILSLMKSTQSQSFSYTRTAKNNIPAAPIEQLPSTEKTTS